MPTLTPVVRKLMILNVAIFVAAFALSFHPPTWNFISQYFGVNPHTWVSAPPYLPIWQVVTYSFLHSLSGLSHLAFNMLGLYFFGTMLESMVGGRKFLYTYFGSVIAGAVLHLVASTVFFEPRAIGASGGVLGIIVAAAVMRPNTPVIFLIFPMLLKHMAMLIVAMDAFAILLFLRDGASGQVAHWVHLGGAAFGFFWARQGAIHVDWQERRETKALAAERQAAKNDEARMDEVLAKVQKEGLHALTPKERDFLQRMSERKKKS